MGKQFDAVLEPRYVRSRHSLSLAVECQFAAEDVLRLEMRCIDDLGSLVLKATFSVVGHCETRRNAVHAARTFGFL